MASRVRSSKSSRVPSRRYNGYSEFYSSSSEAHDILNERYYAPRPEPRKRSKPKRKNVRKKRVSSNRPKYLLDNSNRPKMAIMPIITLVVFFMGLLAVVFFGVRIIEMRMEINALAREYQDLQSENSLKSAQLARSIDLREVEYHAITRLGMVSPAQHQIIHISVPRQNYVVQNLAVLDEEESIFSRISAFSRRVFAMAALW